MEDALSHQSFLAHGPGQRPWLYFWVADRRRRCPNYETSSKKMVVELMIAFVVTSSTTSAAQPFVTPVVDRLRAWVLHCCAPEFSSTRA